MLENLLGGNATQVETIKGNQIAKLLANDGAANDYFGTSVAISSDGSFCFVGAPYDDERGSDSGCVFLFKFNGTSWVFVNKILPPSLRANDGYGWSLALSGDDSTLIVGARGDDTVANAAGAAYIFKTAAVDAWSYVAKLTDTSGSGTAFLGESVALSYDGKTAIVGAQTGGSSYTTQPGTVVVFKNTAGSTWSRVAKFTALGSIPDDYFGNSVGLSSDGTTAVIGAYGKQAAYIFKNTSGNVWTQIEKLSPADAGFYYSKSVAMSGDGKTCLVTGSYQTGGGEVHAFTENSSGWSHTYTIKSLTASSNFGSSVSLTSDSKSCIIGAINTVENGVRSGAAFVFTRTDGGNWEQKTKLLANDGAVSDYFGNAVSISNDGLTCVVAAQYDDDKGSNSGSAYIFK